MQKQREGMCFFLLYFPPNYQTPNIAIKHKKPHDLVASYSSNRMKPFTFLLPIFWNVSHHLLLLFTINLMCFGPKRTAALALGNQTDHLALLKFKESISNDPYGVLNSWNSSTHFCNWLGITCSPMHQRVAELKLQRYQLHGSISAHVGNFSFLTNLNLAGNNFFGKIPQELGRLLQLQQLYLQRNSFSGEIPTNLTNCSNLKALFLERNNLIGKIPNEFGSLQNLRELDVGRNNLTGVIPPFIGNLSFLTALDVGESNLEGDIPQEICRLKNLTGLYVGVNKLSGTFPSCLYNMSSLIIISAAVNSFNVSLPPNMFHNLRNLQIFEIGENQIQGPIPTSIANASTLRIIDIDRNHFTGQVPSLGKLQDLHVLIISFNNLGDNSTKDLEFLKSLTNCSKLSMLSVSVNNFGGSLPPFIGNLSTQLSQLYLGGNPISGQIPLELGNLIGLILLSITNSQLEGTIPTTFGKFKKLQLLSLNGNKLSGDIPISIGNLSQLFELDLYQNMLVGNIPSSIGNCQNLQSLDLSNNNLKGSIPLEVFSLPSLSRLLNLSQNSLSGGLPKEVGKLKMIGMLDVSENHLSGDIPGTIGQCISLEYLRLKGNSFQGIIPSSVASLKGLQYLDLSRNRLSGPIPHVLQNISVLEYLNVSFNMLEGEVPTKGVFGNASALAVAGNIKLCGGISEMHLPPCMNFAKHHNIRLIAVIVSVVALLLILLFLLTVYWMRERNKKLSSDPPTIDRLAKISYQGLRQGTDEFSAINLIGSGSFGSVYKCFLMSEDKVVAVKVLKLQKKGAHKSFIVECNALKNIRHRNMVKILTCCSGTDYNGQDFKALVFDYMRNGSLEQWLHPGTMNVEHPRRLDLALRLHITIDIASALHYLHNECEQLVLHCDLKPSNVLLDDDMVAHVSDFGIARLVSTVDGTSHKDTSSTIGIKGTIGYAPPEYGTGSEVSTYGDMYSFGILILEMLTGRRPTDDVFEDGQNLHMFVETSIPSNLIHILDPHLVPRDEAAGIEDGNSSGKLIPIVEKCLISLFRIGLACSVESPKERMNIADVTRELNIIRKAFLAGVHTR